MTAPAITCPACGGQRSADVGGAAPAFHIEAGGRTLRQPEYHVRQCATCDLYFRVPAIDSQLLPDHYAGQPFELYELGDTFPTELQVRSWLDQLPRGSRVLDFGCSSGRMLKGMTERLVCVGVEPNSAAAAMAATRGIRLVRESDLAGGDLGGFDAILLADVFEHLPAPLEVLTRLASLLAPHGWMAIVTGNADAIRYRDWLAEYWYFRSVEHLQMGSEKHFLWLAGRLGLRLECMVRCSHYALPIQERMRQFLQEWAYATFRSRPRSPAAAMLRLVPRLKRAEHWKAAPALTYRKDHLAVKLARAA